VAASRRALTLLQTRYTAVPFWHAGRALFTALCTKAAGDAGADAFAAAALQARMHTRAHLLHACAHALTPRRAAALRSAAQRSWMPMTRALLLLRRRAASCRSSRGN
jgi:hypothetical protein